MLTLINEGRNEYTAEAKTIQKTLEEILVKPADAMGNVVLLSKRMIKQAMLGN